MLLARAPRRPRACPRSSAPPTRRSGRGRAASPARARGARSPRRAPPEPGSVEPPIARRRPRVSTSTATPWRTSASASLRTCRARPPSITGGYSQERSSTRSLIPGTLSRGWARTLMSGKDLPDMTVASPTWLDWRAKVRVARGRNRADWSLWTSCSHRMGRSAERAADGVAGVVGAGAGVRDLRRGSGVGAARADRAGARRRRRTVGRAGDGTGGGVIVLLVRGDRDRRSLFAMGASAAGSLAFQFASTNLVVELGIVMWVLIGWQFTLAELVGGIVLIATMTLLLRAFVSKRLETRSSGARRTRAGGSCALHGRRGGGGQRGRRRRGAAPEAALGAGLVGCGPQLPQRLGDALPRDRCLDSCWRGSWGCSGRACSTACSW